MADKVPITRQQLVELADVLEHGTAEQQGIVTTALDRIKAGGKIHFADIKAELDLADPYLKEVRRQREIEAKVRERRATKADLEPDRGLLGDIGHVLGTGERFVIQDTPAGDWYVSLKSMFTGEEPNEYNRQEMESFAELLYAAFPEGPDSDGADHFWKVFEGGLVGTILDPITWITIGGGTVAKQGVKALTTKGVSALGRYVDEGVRVAQQEGKFIAEDTLKTVSTRTRLIEEFKSVVAPTQADYIKGGIRLGEFGKFSGIEIPYTRQALDLLGDSVTMAARRFVPKTISDFGKRVFRTGSSIAEVRRAQEVFDNLRNYGDIRLKPLVDDFIGEVRKIEKAGGKMTNNQMLGFIHHIEAKTPVLRMPEWMQPLAVKFYRVPDMAQDFIRQLDAKTTLIGAKARFLERTLTENLAVLSRKHEKLLLEREKETRRALKNFAKAQSSANEFLEMVDTAARRRQVLNEEAKRIIVLTGYRYLPKELASKEAILKAEDALRIQQNAVRNMIDWFPRKLTPEARAAERAIKVGGGRRGTKKLGAARTLLDPKTKVPLPIAKAEQLATEKYFAHGEYLRKDSYWRKVFGRSLAPGTVFERDPLKLIKLTGEDLGRQVGIAGFWRHIARTMGVSRLEKTAGFEQAPKALQRQFPELVERYFRKTDLVEIDRVFQKIKAPEEIAGFLNLWDNVNGFLRGSQTVLWPAFHFRNAVSNIYLNWIAGVNDPRVYKDAALIQMLARGERKAGKTLKDLDQVLMTDIFGVSHTRRQILEAARQEGVITRNIIDLDVMARVEDGLGFTMGRNLGAGIETNARLAHFIDMVRKGESFVGAGRSVKRYLFDYSDLTDFEKMFMRRAVFFYTFQRKNIPLQIATLLRDPKRIAIPFHAKRAIEAVNEDAQELTDRYTPDFLKDVLFAGVAGEDAHHIRALTGLGLPFEDLAKVELSWRNAEQSVLGALSPVLKYPLEMAARRNFFIGKPFEEHGVINKMPVPEIFRKLPKGIQRYMGLERKTRDGEDIFVADPRVATTLYVLPFSRVISTFKLSREEQLVTWETLVRAFFGFRYYEMDVAALKRSARKRARKETKAARRAERTLEEEEE